MHLCPVEVMAVVGALVGWRAWIWYARHRWRERFGKVSVETRVKYDHEDGES